MKKLSLFTGMFLTFSSFCSAATLTSLDKDQVTKLMNDNTFVSIATDNLNGKTIENTFSMYVDGKGNILGKMSHKPKNEPKTDKGVYSIKEDGTIFFTWQHWDGAKELCAHIYETKNAYLAIGCDEVFHTAFMKESVKSGNHLKD
jgi:hypothetical protein